MTAIAVAFDGSADAERALQWGVDLARKQSAPLTVRIPAEDELDDFLATQWAAEAEALLSFCGLDEWSVAIDSGQFADETSRSVLILPTSGFASELATSACPYLSGSLTDSFFTDAPPVVTVRRALDEASTQVVVGVCDIERARESVRFGYDHADWIGGSVRLVDLTGTVRDELQPLVDELAAIYPHLPVTVSAAEGDLPLIDLSREAVLLVVAPDAAPSHAEMLRTDAACSVAVLR